MVDKAARKRYSLGVVHIAPLLVIVVLALGIVVASSTGRKSDNDLTRQDVLSENSGSGSSDSEERDGSSGSSNDKDNSGSGSSNSGSSFDDSDGDEQENDSSGTGGLDVTSTQRDGGDGKNDEEEIRTEVRYTSGVRVRTRVEDGRKRIDIYEGGRKLRIETRDGVTVVKVENDEEEEIEEIELADEEEVEVEATGGARLRITTRQNRILLKQGLIEAATNFPVSVNQETGELTITTPAGTKVVTVLPQAAVENMLASNVIDRILSALPPSPTGTAESSPGATTAAEVETGQEIEIEEQDGEIVYVVEGAAEERFLGLFDVLVPKTVVVSADNGEIVRITQTLLSRALDLVSF